jgi:hypothetical protein
LLSSQLPALLMIDGATAGRCYNLAKVFACSQTHCCQAPLLSIKCSVGAVQQRWRWLGSGDCMCKFVDKKPNST